MKSKLIREGIGFCGLCASAFGLAVALEIGAPLWVVALIMASAVGFVIVGGWNCNGYL